MPQLKFNAEPHHVLEVDDQTVHGGETFEVSDEQTKALLAQGIPVSPTNLRSLKRAEVDELLEKAGHDPSDYPNLDAAIEALEAPPEAVGEGQENETSEQENL
jgi:hypothetical protein